MGFLIPIGTALGVGGGGTAAGIAGGLAVASAAVGVASGIKGLTSGGPGSPDAPGFLGKIPTPGDSAKKAAEELKRRRRISLISGGQTKTIGEKLIPEANIARKSLIGE